MRVTVLYSIVGSDQITGSEIFPGGDTVLDKKKLFGSCYTTAWA